MNPEASQPIHLHSAPQPEHPETSRRPGLVLVLAVVLFVLFWASILLIVPYEELDSIINQANELGTYFFLYSGGEPLVRKKDIIRLCEAHPDCQFTAFTNGTLIDEAFADEMLRVKNFIPAISVEGFEEATDFRRGAGTFA